MEPPAAVLEACSYDVHTHIVAGDAHGLMELADVIASATSTADAVSLDFDHSEGRWPGCPGMVGVDVRTLDLGPLLFSRMISRQRIVGGRRALGALARSLMLLAYQERSVDCSSPRLAPRWFEGTDFLVRESDEVTFYQLPIDPPLRLRRGT